VRAASKTPIGLGVSRSGFAMNPTLTRSRSRDGMALAHAMDRRSLPGAMRGCGRQSCLIMSTPSRAPEGVVPAVGGIEGGALQAQAEVALGAALDLVVQECSQELHKRELLPDGLAVAELEGLEDPRQAQGAEHQGELMSQFHTADLLSSALGSGKKVQERAWRGTTAGPAHRRRERGERLVVERRRPSPCVRVCVGGRARSERRSAR
jgi:hypothetical protein